MERRSWWCSCQVRFVGAQQAHLDEGDDGEDQEQRHGQRRRVSEVPAPERLVEDVDVDHAAGVDGSALRGHVDGVEDLERADQGDHQHDRQHRSKQRQRDAEEALHLAATVSERRLLHVLRDRLQAGEQQQRRVPHVPPHVDQRDRWDRPLLRRRQ